MNRPNNDANTGDTGAALTRALHRQAYAKVRLDRAVNAVDAARIEARRAEDACAAALRYHLARLVEVAAMVPNLPEIES